MTKTPAASSPIERSTSIPMSAGSPNNLFTAISDKASFINSNRLFFIKSPFRRMRIPQIRKRPTVGMMLDLDERIAVTRT
jgi:hypothetical protein